MNEVSIEDSGAFRVTSLIFQCELELNSILLRSETDENRVHSEGIAKAQRTYDSLAVLHENADEWLDL